MNAGLMPESRKLIKVVRNLRAAGFEPVLVGGLALILFGSERVTFDCDLVAVRPENLEAAKLLVGAMHGAGCFYVSRLDKRRRPLSWLDNINIAASKILMDEPDTVFFWNPDIELKIDILMDFPLKASDLLASATNKKLDRTTIIKVASLNHLKTMKEIAIRARKEPKDVQDLDFIKKCLR